MMNSGRFQWFLFIWFSHAWVYSIVGRFSLWEWEHTKIVILIAMCVLRQSPHLNSSRPNLRTSNRHLFQTETARIKAAFSKNLPGRLEIHRKISELWTVKQRIKCSKAKWRRFGPILFAARIENSDRSLDWANRVLEEPRGGEFIDLWTGCYHTRLRWRTFHVNTSFIATMFIRNFSRCHDWETKIIMENERRQQ